MNKNENTDFIKSIYESQKQELPEALSKENIISELQSVSQEKPRGRIIPLRRIASVAAVIIVVICAGFAGGKLWKDSYTQSLKTEEYADIETHFLNLYSEYKTEELMNYAGEIIYGGIGAINGSISDDKLAMDEAEPEQGVPQAPGEALPVPPTQAATDSTVSNSQSNHGQTNIQVADVDEADIIKNDGEYIYVLTGSGKDNLYSGDVIHIIRGSDLEEVTTLSVERKKDTVFSGKEMYVDDDKIVLIGLTAEVKIDDEKESPTVYNGAMVPGYATDAMTYIDYGFAYAVDYDTVIFTYDISDITKPKLISEKMQSGEYNSSRMIDGILYTVSNYYVDVYNSDSEKDVIENCIPKVNGERIPAEDIEAKIEKKIRRYTIITSSDTNSEDLSGASYAYLGDSDKIYCSANTLYFVSSEFDGEKQMEKTIINAISLSKDKISRKAKGSVYGYLNNQFSMDEYNGYLRVATTGYNPSTFKNESNLYILDGELKIVGKLEDIADNEQVKSVRFVGKKAYVVTFRNTDPLFVINLSNPEKPKITGEVKLPGYSTYLHPIGADYIVGVGFGGTEESANFSALKVTLFDVSDDKNPKVASNFEVCEAETEISNYDNHKAFLYYPQKNLIGIPVRKHNYSGGYGHKEVLSYAMLEIDEGELKLKNGYAHQQEDTSYIRMFRGTYIDDILYTISENSICAFDLHSGELVNKTEYK